MNDAKHSYDFRGIEKKCAEKWNKLSLYKTTDFDKKPKKYVLVEFPYPSGEGLHVGHSFTMTGADVYARKLRMSGNNVLFPMGWDAFGLPTENYAIKTGQQPQLVTKKNTDTFRKQMEKMAFSFDWDREVNTTDPKYYRWTQWIFVQLFKKGLAYKEKKPINWCPSCRIGLANEEVIDGKCERCGTEAYKKDLDQWIVKITDYAERLIDGLKDTDFIEKVKAAQINWIGKSEGAEIEFKVKDSEERIKVFTTRPDTLYGATFMVLSPEHNLVAKIEDSEVKKYILESRKKSEMERTELSKEKTGVFSGLYAINPATEKEIPIWISDFILSTYGTGAIMAVPAHDQRDFEFAKKYELPTKEVVIPKTIDKHDPPIDGVKTVFRKAVQVILIDPKTNEVLCLKWKKFPWTTFITGGLEGNEDIIEGAKREVLEETGYKNIKYIRTLGGPVESHFYANHKGENRKAMFNALVFELKNDEKISVTDEENQIHEAVWMSWEEIKDDKNVKCSEYEIWLDRFFNSEHAYGEPGILINSEIYDGLTSEDASKKIIAWLEEKKIGKKTISYHLRDWIFSRQHYWGEPIPMIFCEECGWVPVPEEQLPVELPKVEKYEPTETGESPLSKIKEWVEVKCPECGGTARRETDVMPNWAGSDWYFLRYCDPRNSEKLADLDKMKYWMPVDIYIGGDEHNTLHLLYSRFIYQFLHDIGAVPKEIPEPYFKRISHGVVLGPDGQRMSKSKGNVIIPDEIWEAFGVDALRVYMMFMGPFDSTMAWSQESLEGCLRFLKRVWNLVVGGGHEGDGGDKGLTRKLHQTIKKVGEDIENLKFNTAVAVMMGFLNEMTSEGEKIEVGKETIEKFLIILAPFAPYITEELWRRLGNSNSIHEQKWPEYDPKLIAEETVTMVIQVNGKLRDSINVQSEVANDQPLIRELAKNSEKVKKYLEDKEIKKVVFVSGKLLNFVI